MNACVCYACVYYSYISYFIIRDHTLNVCVQHVYECLQACSTHKFSEGTAIPPRFGPKLAKNIKSPYFWPFLAFRLPSDLDCPSPFFSPCYDHDLSVLCICASQLRITFYSKRPPINGTC